MSFSLSNISTDFKEIIYKINNSNEEEGIDFLKKVFSTIEDDVQSRNLKSFIFYNVSKRKIQQCVNEESPLAWQWYVKKDSVNVKTGVYGNDPNVNFGTACHDQVCLFLNKMRKGEIQSLEDIYVPLSSFRRDLAEKSGTQNFKNFGAFRDLIASDYEQHYGDAYRTHLGGFPNYKKRILKNIEQQILSKKPIKAAENIKVYDLEENSITPFYVATYKNEIVYASIIMLDNQNEPLIINRILLDIYAAYPIYQFETIEGPLNDTLFNLSNKTPCFIHCSCKHIDFLWPKANQLFSEIVSFKVKDSNDKKLVLNKIAELHWLLSNMMRTARGNGAISEMVITTLLLYHDFFLSPYKSEILGDVEALSTPKSQFIANYRFLRENDLLENSHPLSRSFTSLLNSKPTYPFSLPADKESQEEFQKKLFLD